MAKRFIDTELFSDEWFMGLSVKAKLFYVYLITNCDHAGIIKLNFKLAEFQTGINSLLTVSEELDNRLVRVSEELYFLPKFISFQYPGFPNSRVRQQESALKKLKELGLINEESLTVSKDLAKSYVHVSDNVSDNDILINKRSSEKKQEIPAFDEFRDYALTEGKKNVDLYALEMKYKSWVNGGWRDGNGKEIKTWKTKLLNTLPYLPEQKKQEQTDLTKAGFLHNSDY